MANYIKYLGKPCCPVPTLNLIKDRIIITFRPSIDLGLIVSTYLYLAWDCEKEQSLEGCVDIIGVDLFKEIRIDNEKINIAELDSNYGEYLFNDTNLHTVEFTLNKNIDKIPDYTFGYDNALESVFIPNLIKQIGNEVFSLNPNLKSITLESIIPPILGEYVFSGVSGNFKIYVPCEAVNAYKTAPTWLKYRSRIKGIDCTNESTAVDVLLSTIYKVGFPEGAVLSELYYDVGENYFDSLEINVDSPEWLIEGNENPSIADIDANGGTYRFNSNWDGWNDYSLPPTFNVIFKLKDGVTELPSMESSDLVFIEIPDTITSIKERSFLYTFDLNSLYIPRSVINIESPLVGLGNRLLELIVDENNPKYDSRDNCNAVIETDTDILILGCQNTVIPETVKAIGYSAFLGCNITTINIPYGITSIGDYAFCNCQNLSRIDLPQSITNIGDGAFKWGPNYITLDSSTPPTLGSDVFNNTPLILVPPESLELYKQAPGWSNYANHIHPNLMA